MGKSTLARMIWERRGCPWIDYGRLREFHLRPDWSNENAEEEAMTFENLICIVQNYWRHGYPEVLVDDLRDHRIVQIASAFPAARVDIVTLTMSDASAWNEAVLARPAAAGEVKLDVTNLSPEEVFRRAEAVLGE